jgi:cytidylate kinase
MTVVTILRELGSGGGAIGREAAQALGYDYVDKEVIEGIFRQYGLTKFDQVYNTLPSFLDMINYSNLLIVSMLNEIIEAVAQRGNAVLLIRGGFAILEGCADVLNVRIHAPISVRAPRLMTREHLSDLWHAEEQIAEDDKLRSKFLQTFYDRRWEDQTQFDLVLDTGALTLEAATAQLVAAAHALAAKPVAADATTTAKFKVDPVLADAVAKVLANPLPALPPAAA